jgi:hypothetical protein
MLVKIPLFLKIFRDNDYWEIENVYYLGFAPKLRRSPKLMLVIFNVLLS